MKGYSRFGKNTLLQTGILMAMLFVFSACQTPTEVSLSPFAEAHSYFEFVMINEDFFVSEENILHDPEQNEFSKLTYTDDSNFSPLYVRRVITSIERSFSYEAGNQNIVIATMVRTIRGEFRMRGNVRGAAGESTVIKEFTETAVRRALFERIDQTGVVEHDWKLAAISLLDGGTSERGFDIVNMKMEVRGGDSFEFDDPLDTYLQIGNANGGVPSASIAEFRSSGFRLEITIESTNEDPEILFLRHGGVIAGGQVDSEGGYMRRARIPSESSEEMKADVYVRTYVIDWTPFAQFTGVAARGPDIQKGRMSAIVETISYDALYNTAAPVTTNYWGVPFIIK